MFGLAEVAVATVVGGAWVVSASSRFARFVLVQEEAQEKERLAQEEKERQTEWQEDYETIAVREGFAEKRRMLERSRETYAKACVAASNDGNAGGVRAQENTSRSLPKQNKGFFV